MRLENVFSGLFAAETTGVSDVAIQKCNNLVPMEDHYKLHTAIQSMNANYAWDTNVRAEVDLFEDTTGTVWEDTADGEFEDF